MTKNIPVVKMKRWLRYNSCTGKFVWKIRKSSTIRAGQIAGTMGTGGYTMVHFDNEVYMASRVAYTWVYGSIPEELHVDHVDGNRSNNSIWNLRVVTNSQNMMNTKPHDATKPKGVHRHGKGYRAQLTINGKLLRSIAFDTEKEAVRARKQLEEQYHKGFTFG